MIAPAKAPPLPPASDQQPWPAQGNWTYEDYLRLPDDGRRYEIIEGVLYVANAPDFDHQFTVSQLLRLIGNFVAAKLLGVVLIAPFEIHLSGIAKPVQPDVFFIRAEQQPKSGTQIFEGVPDLIVEVLSPGTMRVDQYVKFGAYEKAGVPEYWLADPKTRSIEIYTLSGGEYALLGQFGPGEKVRAKVLGGDGVGDGQPVRRPQRVSTLFKNEEAVGESAGGFLISG